MGGSLAIHSIPSYDQAGAAHITQHVFALPGTFSCNSDTWHTLHVSFALINPEGLLLTPGFLAEQHVYFSGYCPSYELWYPASWYLCYAPSPASMLGLILCRFRG
jgi:hypothetical protein